MRLFLFSIFALIMFVLPASADIDWDTATVEDVQREINTNKNADEEFLTKLLVEACAKSRNLEVIDEIIRSDVKIDKKVIHTVMYNNKFIADLFALSKQGNGNVDEEVLEEASLKYHSLMQKLFEKRVDEEMVPNFGLEEWWQIANAQDIQKELDSGADINGGVYKGFITPLEMALVLHKNYDIVKLLIDNGANVNNFGFMHPLKIAVDNSPLDVVELLLKNGADVLNKDLIWQTYIGNKEETTELLLKYGADINEKNSDGWTVLESLLAGGELEKAKLWVKKGASVPKDILAREHIYYKITPEIIDFLVEQGADINAKYYDKYNEYVFDTSLIFAVQSPVNAKVIEKLLEHGADVNAKNSRDETALDNARNEEIRELLIKYGAK